MREVATQLVKLLAALFMAEVNVHFTYPLLTRPRGFAALALHVDDTECASSVLMGEGFKILSQRRYFPIGDADPCFAGCAGRTYDSPPELTVLRKREFTDMGLSPDANPSFTRCAAPIEVSALRWV